MERRELTATRWSLDTTGSLGFHIPLEWGDQRAVLRKQPAACHGALGANNSPVSRWKRLLCGLVCGLRLGIPRCPRIRHTIHKSFVGLTSALQPGGICHPGLHSPQQRRRREGPGAPAGTDGDGQGRAEVQSAPLCQRQVLRLGSHLFWAYSCELSAGAGKGRAGLRPCEKRRRKSRKAAHQSPATQQPCWGCPPPGRLGWAAGKDDCAAVVPTYARAAFQKSLQVSSPRVYAVSFWTHAHALRSHPWDYTCWQRAEVF